MYKLAGSRGGGLQKYSDLILEGLLIQYSGGIWLSGFVSNFRSREGEREGERAGSGDSAVNEMLFYKKKTKVL